MAPCTQSPYQDDTVVLVPPPRGRQNGQGPLPGLSSTSGQARLHGCSWWLQVWGHGRAFLSWLLGRRVHRRPLHARDPVAFGRVSRGTGTVSGRLGSLALR